MGTSLSGLTPATTFDGLLKTSDNDAITSSLKTIGSGDGTDSCLQLSDSALKVNSGAVTIVGVGNTGATSSLLIQNSSASDLLRVNDSGEIRMQTLDFLGNKITSLARISTSGLAINNAGTSPDANTQLHIKGSGATSATTSLLVQNSSGGSVFSIRDDGALLFHRVSNSAELLRIDDAGSAPRFVQGNNVGKSFTLGNDSILSAFTSIQFKTYDGSAYSEAMRITGNTDQFVGIGEPSPTARLHVKGSGNDNTTTSLLVENSDASASLTYDDSGKVEIVGNSQTGFIQTYGFGAVGFGNESGPAILYGNNLSGVHTNNGYTAFGANSSSSQRVLIKGSGATSATTSLLVQNSAGTDMFKVEDGGNISITGFTFQSNIIKPNINGFIGIDHNSNRNFSVIDSNGNRTYLKVQSSSSSSFADVSINTDHLVVKKEGDVSIGTSSPTARLHVKAGTTQDSIAKFEDPRATTDYIEIKNDSTLTDYTGLYWGTVAKIRSKQTGAMFLDCTSGILFADGNSARNKIDANGNMSIGTATIPASTRVNIKGSGATSATTALLVENSAGTDTLKVRDDGQINFNGNIYADADYKSIGRNSLNSIRYAGGETRVAVQGTSSSNRFHIYASSTATSVFSVYTQGQQVGIGNGNTALESTAKLQVDSTTQGFLPPRMTGTQRDAIESPASGLIIYNTTTNKAQCYNGTDWNDMF